VERFNRGGTSRNDIVVGPLQAELGIVAHLLGLEREASNPSTDERLSGLSTRVRELLSDISCFGVESDEEFMGQGDADGFFRFSGSTLVESNEVWIETADDDEEDGSDCAATSSNSTTPSVP
jgi:hypothetical protein